MKRQTLQSFALTLTALFAGLFLGGQITRAAFAAGADPYAQLEVLARVLAQIRTHYVADVEDDTLIAAAIRGMTDQLDENSRWMDPEQWAAVQAQDAGQYAGVGAVFTPTGAAGVRVEEVFPQSPAALAGLQVGDHVVGIDGQATVELPLAQVTERLRGERGSTVTLTVVRGASPPFELPITRDIVHAPAARGAWLQGNVGYVYLEQFRYGSAEQLATELRRLDRERPAGLAGLVLDLRENPGGLLDQAVAVADLFLGEALVVSVRGHPERGQLELLHADADAEDFDFPMVVLVNARSASASEIVASALQHHQRAWVIGETTYGKGSVQTYFEYPDHSALRLTIAHYHLPSGRVLQRGDGVRPDQEVLLPLAGADPLAALRDTVGQTRLSAQERQELLSLVDQLPASAGERLAPPLTGPMEERLRLDPQLAAALAHLQRPPR